MECPSCGGGVKDVCSCGFIVKTREIKKGMLVDGSVHVLNCNLRVCVKRDGKETIFCKHLLSLKQVSDGYLVECDPIFRGEVIH